MPLADAGFPDKDTGHPDNGRLIAFGPTLRVTVSQFNQVTETGNTATQVVAALVDTGASESCIDNKLAEELGLPVIDKIDMSGVSGMEKHNVYLASVHIPDLVRLAARAVQERCPPVFVCNPSVNIRHAQGF